MSLADNNVEVFLEGEENQNTKIKTESYVFSGLGNGISRGWEQKSTAERFAKCIILYLSARKDELLYVTTFKTKDLFFLPPIELILTSLRERAKTFFNRFFTSNGKTIKIIYLAISLVYSLCACPGLIKITHTTGKKCRCTWKPSLKKTKTKTKTKTKEQKKIMLLICILYGMNS